MTMELLPDDLRGLAAVMSAGCEDLPSLPINRPAWMARAACRDADPAIFFPEVGTNATAAKAVCAGCGEREICLGYALDNCEPGIWGGTSERERTRMRRRPHAVRSVSA